MPIKHNSESDHPTPDQQCDDCQWNWKFMGASEGGHCYMFRERVEDCYKRRPVEENADFREPAQ